MLDFPASGTALWAIYDATELRPEYLLPVLWAESGFNPAVQNLAGAPYYGLNQISASFLQSKGITPGDYLTWPASQQISQVVQPYMAGVISSFGPLNSGTRVEQANFYPASLATAKSLDSVIVSRPSAAYSANAGLDFSKDGTITVQDLATFLSRGIASSRGAVASAINQTYQLRPGERPEDPVLGTDFGAGSIAAVARTVLLAGSIVVVAAIAAEAILPGSTPFSPKKLRRADLALL